MEAGEVNAAYRRIQVHEAEVARTGARLENAPPCTSEAAGHEQALCTASTALCSESDTLRDDDARARCARARGSCQSAAARRATCRTQGMP